MKDGRRGGRKDEGRGRGGGEGGGRRRRWGLDNIVIKVGEVRETQSTRVTAGIVCC